MRSPRNPATSRGYSTTDNKLVQQTKAFNSSRQLGTSESKSGIMQKTQSDYLLMNEDEIANKGFAVTGGGEYIVKSTQNYAKKKEPENGIIRNVSEYVLQDNGKYKLKDTGLYFIRRNSEYLSDVDHPFAPSSTENRKSFSSDDITRRNVRNLHTDSPSSSDFSSLSSGKQPNSQKSETGLVLTRVVRVLEATPPQFLMVPENYPIRSSSPTPTVFSTVGTNTVQVPPNTSHGNRLRQSRSTHRTPVNESHQNNRHTLFRHHSSPELFRERQFPVSNKNISRSPSPSRHRNFTSPDTASRNYLSPALSRRLTTTPIAGGYMNSNYLNPQMEGSSSYTDKDFNPPHLRPTPLKRLVRRKSLLSVSSTDPTSANSSSTSTSGSRSPMKSPLKTNIHGLVYI